jgi:CheY-like chemotaxis protein
MLPDVPVSLLTARDTDLAPLDVNEDAKKLFGPSIDTWYAVMGIQPKALSAASETTLEVTHTISGRAYLLLTRTVHDIVHCVFLDKHVAPASAALTRPRRMLGAGTATAAHQTDIHSQILLQLLKDGAARIERSLKEATQDVSNLVQDQLMIQDVNHILTGRFELLQRGSTISLDIRSILLDAFPERRAASIPSVQGHVLSDRRNLTRVLSLMYGYMRDDACGIDVETVDGEEVQITLTTSTRALNADHQQFLEGEDLMPRDGDAQIILIRGYVRSIRGMCALDAAGRGFQLTLALPVVWKGPEGSQPPPPATPAATKPKRRGSPESARSSLSDITSDVPLASVAPAEYSVLIVEDNGLNAKILKTAVEGWGRQMIPKVKVVIAVAGDGAEAVRMHEAAPFDIICMDVQLPVMTGVEATQAIRASDASAGRKEVPIIAISGNRLDPHESELFTEEMPKPFNAKNLREMLTRYLRPGSG